MELPPGTSVKVMNEWMREEMKDDLFGSIIWEKKVNGEPQDMATSVFEEFEDEVFSLGTGFLCGCTTLVIISRKAVYIGHYWENISFSPDKVWLDLYKTSEAAFKRTVINGLTVGVGRGTYPEQVSLKGQKHRIQDSYLHAYLMIPSDNSEGYEDGYRDKWEQIKEIVNGILPDLSTGDRWTEVKYKPLLKDSKLLENTARGRILFKYDPNHNGKKKTALWIEQNATPYHDDEW